MTDSEKIEQVRITHVVDFIDGRSVTVEDPNKITQAICGLCLYADSGNGESILYPWHTVKSVRRLRTEKEEVRTG